MLRAGFQSDPEVEATVSPSLAFYTTCADVDALVAALLRLQSDRPGSITRSAAAPDRRRAYMPPPSSKDSLRALACVTLVSGGTLCVSQTLPPMDEPRPMVIRPRTVAPA